MSGQSDPAQWASASEEIDFAAEIDSREDRFREIIDRRFPGGKPSKNARECILGMIHECLALGRDEDADGGNVGALMVKLADLLTLSNSPLLVLECLRFVFNLSFDSQTVIAERHGQSRANVSRICVEICERLGVVPGRGMKSERAREAYRERACDVHAKRHARYDRPEFVDEEWANIIDATFDTAADIDEHDNKKDKAA